MAASVRDLLVERWNQTYAHFTEKDPKMMYYLSMEYLQVRAGGHGGTLGRAPPAFPSDTCTLPLRTRAQRARTNCAPPPSLACRAAR